MRETLQRPEHPAVDWTGTSFTGGQTVVRVTCPDCLEPRLEAAKSVSFRLRKRKFSGRCWTCSRRVTRQAGYPNHPAIDWTSKRPGAGEQLVAVTCPVCSAIRWLGAKGVSRAVARGTFTGHCLADRFVGRIPLEGRPQAPGVEWRDARLQWETGLRRRTMVRVRCPDCEVDRWCHASHVAKAIQAGNFRPECRRHRALLRLSSGARERIWDSIWLFGAGEAASATRCSGAAG